MVFFKNVINFLRLSRGRLRHKERVTIVELPGEFFLVGKLVADVLQKPYYNLTQITEKNKKLPEQCVVSRPTHHILDPASDGFTVVLEEICDDESKKDKSLCLKNVMRELVQQRLSRY